MIRVRPLLTALLAMSIVTSAQARPFRVGQIPNGTVNSCANCHVNPAGGGARNDFGKLVERFFLDEVSSTGNVQWNAYLASLDADGDGASNGLELQDEYGEWSSGDPAPGDPAKVTKPYDALLSSPLRNLSITFSDMDPHVGQDLYIRVIDKGSRREVVRMDMPEITSSFAVQIEDVIVIGHSYHVEFFVDANDNGVYDDPPTDHSWTADVDDAAGNETINFAHNTNFDTLDWHYRVHLHLSDFSVHVGQWFEVILSESDTRREIDRRILPFLPASNYTVDLTGIGGSGSYRLDFFADADNNGIYSGAGLDHSYSAAANSDGNDVDVNFAHNTNFQQLDWTYNTTVYLHEMDPHIGQQFGLRVIDSSTGLQNGFELIDALELPDFSVTVGRALPGAVVRQIDMYADLNGNMQYDAPPSDHAWRILNEGTVGNQVVNFHHNTDFTDINWSTSGVRELPNQGLPQGFALEQNHPNPFNPSTRIEFRVASQGPVRLAIYDLTGREIARLVDKPMSPGSYSVDFVAGNLPSGVYFYRLESDGFSRTRRLTLVK